MKTLIVGAGLSGLMLADKISPAREVMVVEKARGVGGRLATRRIELAKFDHGAQFYRLKGPLSKMHERWMARNLVKLWFTENGESHFNAIGGMTSLAKDLASGVDVVTSERIVTINDTPNDTLKMDVRKWSAVFESGRVEFADEIVFTCPVPQALDILRASGIQYNSVLDQVVYSKALVALFENSPVPFLGNAQGYFEPLDSPIFSVADQRAKQVSAVDALTVTLGAEASSMHFDLPDEATIRFTVEELRKLSPNFKPGFAQLKKWRYCQVQKSFGELYTEIKTGLYLAGDGFGGASLNGAARSSQALAQHLLK